MSTQNILNNSNIHKYINSLSRPDILKLLNPQTSKQSGQSTDQDEQEKYNQTIAALSDFFGSLTSEGKFIREIVKDIYEKHSEQIIKGISQDIKIIHSKKPYQINIIKNDTDTTQKNTNEIDFYIKKEALNKKKDKFEYTEKYGLIKKDDSTPNPDELHNLEEMAGVDTKEYHVNNVGHNNELKESKDNTSFAYVLIDNPNLRAGSRNLTELTTFFNTLSTIELSKCYPYLNVTLILPKIFNTNSGSIYESATINGFLRGTSNTTDNVSDFYKGLSNNKIQLNIAPDASATPDTGKKSGTNLSIFTMPQTVVNFNEKRIGNYDDINLEEGDTKRLNSIHDIARPFMSIKNFSVDVAPTQGLMSFKTGKLSLVLHDKSRLPEIAPFIKADLFGTSGSEIAIEYGWDSIDKDNKHNFLAQFLANNRIIEKYIITNSSFNMSNNGEVNIDLSIAVKGPLELRTVKIGVDEFTNLDSLKSTLSELFNVLNNSVKTKLTELQSQTQQQQQKQQSQTETENLNKFITYIEKLNNAYQKINFESFRNLKTKNKDALSDDDKYFNIDLNSITIKNSIFIYTDIDSSSSINIDLNNYLQQQQQQQKQITSFIDKLNEIKNELKSAQKKLEEITKKIIGGLGVIDPFYNKDLVFDYYRVGDTKIKNSDPKYIKVGGLPETYSTSDSTDGATDYVTFGAILTGFVGKHLCNSKKYDEIQIMSYTANKNSGLMAYRNLSSIMIKRSELNDFLIDLFKGGKEFSIEGIMSQILNRFVTTRSNICYGLESLYKKDAKTGTITPVFTDTKLQTKNVNQKLTRIYKEIINDRIKQQTSTVQQQIPEIEPTYAFEMPKIKLTFDTLTSKNDGLERTILRISVYDELDNPFNAISDIIFSNRGNEMFRTISYLNRIGLEKGKKEFQEIGSNIIENLIKLQYLIDLGDGRYQITDKFGFLPVKKEFKRIMPSLTYGTENSAILDASVTTINEAKLNTVFLTRGDSQQNETTKAVVFPKDLPLRVLPSQASITTFGCPFVNFAQYYFLDFSTGTTIDNVYAVTGIKHDITPGKFTTSITLSYGDIYGKYDNVINTLDNSQKKTLDKVKEEKKGTKKDKFNCIKDCLFEEHEGKSLATIISAGEGKPNSIYADNIYELKKAYITILGDTGDEIILTNKKIKDLITIQNNSEFSKAQGKYLNAQGEKLKVKSNAIGKYQIQGLKDKLNKNVFELTEQDNFTEDNQDKLFASLMYNKNIKIINKVIENKNYSDSDLKDFILNLAYEFSSILNIYYPENGIYYFDTQDTLKFLTKKQAKNNEKPKDFKRYSLTKNDTKTKQLDYLKKHTKLFFECLIKCISSKQEVVKSKLDEILNNKYIKIKDDAKRRGKKILSDAGRAAKKRAKQEELAAKKAEIAKKRAEQEERAAKKSASVDKDKKEFNIEIVDEDPSKEFKENRQVDLYFEIKDIDFIQNSINTLHAIEKIDENNYKLIIRFNRSSNNLQKINDIVNKNKNINIITIDDRLYRLQYKKGKYIFLNATYYQKIISDFIYKINNIEELIKYNIEFIKNKLYYKDINEKINELQNDNNLNIDDKNQFNLIINKINDFKLNIISDKNNDQLSVLYNLENSTTQDKIINMLIENQNNTKDIENYFINTYFYLHEIISNIYNNKINYFINLQKKYSKLLSYIFDIYFMCKILFLIRNDYYKLYKAIDTNITDFNEIKDLIEINSFNTIKYKTINIEDQIKDINYRIRLNLNYNIDNTIKNNYKFYKNFCKFNNNIMNLTFDVKDKKYLENLNIINKDIINLKNIFENIIKNIYIDDLNLDINKINVNYKIDQLIALIQEQIQEDDINYDNLLFFINLNLNKNIYESIQITKGLISLDKKEIQKYFLNHNTTLKNAYDEIKKGNLTNKTIIATEFELQGLFKNPISRRLTMIVDIDEDNIIFTRLGDDKIKKDFSDSFFTDKYKKDNLLQGLNYKYKIVN